MNHTINISSKDLVRYLELIDIVNMQLNDHKTPEQATLLESFQGILREIISANTQYVLRILRDNGIVSHQLMEDQHLDNIIDNLIDRIKAQELELISKSLITHEILEYTQGFSTPRTTPNQKNKRII